MNKRIDIFKEEPGFLKLFSLFKEKYRSLGRVGGNVPINSFQQKELESIAGFLGIPTDELIKKGSIGLAAFEKELRSTGFADYDLLKLMEELLQESILTKKEEIEREQAEEKQFIDDLKVLVPDFFWIDWIVAKSPDTRWIWSLYKQDKEGLVEKLVHVCTAFSKLPEQGKYERLPVFAQRITGNPHYFDPNETAGKMLLHCLYVDQRNKGNDQAMMPKSVEELNDLLAEYGIMRDDLWNFVTCQGLLASSTGDVHPVWQTAVDTQSVLNMPLKELVKVDKIWPAKGSHIWIIENSSVCSTVMDAVPAAPIICTHGQLRAASWHLLDELAQTGCTLHYSGDLDPEGILIADKLKKRYGKQLHIWRMDVEAYETTKSNEDISNRFSKIERLSTTSEWKELVSLMKASMKAGYQEGIVGRLIDDIRNNSLET